MFVGGYDEMEILYELDLLPRIIQKGRNFYHLDYEKECILCDEPKTGE